MIDITSALAALSPTNPVLYLPGGVYDVDTDDSAIKLTSSAYSVRGDGMWATTIRQNGKGSLIEANAGDEYVGLNISDLCLEGTGTGSHGIIAKNIKDSSIRRVRVAGFRDSAIKLHGDVGCLHNEIRNNRIVVPKNSNPDACCIETQFGTTLEIAQNYFIQLGEGRFSLDLMGCDGVNARSNIYEGLSGRGVGIRTSGNAMLFGELFYDPAYLYAVVLTANNPLYVVGGRGFEKKDINTVNWNVDPSVIHWI